MAITRQRLSLEEFLRLPEAEPALEYWHGEVSQKVSAKGPHGALQYGLAQRISLLTSPPRRFRVFTEVRVTFGGMSTVPDLIVYRRERVPRDAAGRVADDFTTPPDLAVEILSLGQSRREQIDRCHWYVENGVPLALFIDPYRLVVRLVGPGADSGDLRGADRLDLGASIPGFSLSVDELFAPLSADWE